MDTATAHVLQRLDTIIDRQAEIKALLLTREQSAPEPRLPVEVAEVKTASNLFSRLQKLPLHWQWIMGGIASWGISASISSFLANGGDPVKLIETFLGLFVSAVS
jgi:hypothetical protein